MAAIEYFIKRIGLANAELAKTINKPVFHVFLHAMLFLSIYKIDNLSSIESDYICYGAVTVIVSLFATSVAVFGTPMVQKMISAHTLAVSLWFGQPWSLRYGIFGVVFA